MHSNEPYTATSYAREVPVVVQILSTLLFGGFAIASVAIAFNFFWPAGVALAIILGWRGGFAPVNMRRPETGNAVELVAKLSPEAERRSSGNASFDAYREDVLARLEQEQTAFDGFLQRLRHAKDMSEFDQFMDDRAKRVIDAA